MTCKEKLLNFSYCYLCGKIVELIKNKDVSTEVPILSLQSTGLQMLWFVLTRVLSMQQESQFLSVNMDHIIMISVAQDGICPNVLLSHCNIYMAEQAVKDMRKYNKRR